MRAVMLDAARWAAIVTAASLPFSTALMNLSAALAFVCWALSGRWRESARAIAAEPAAWIGWALFGALAAGIAWSLAPAAEAADVLAKYRELLLFGVVMFLFAERRWRARLLWTLFAAGVALLLASWAVHLGIVESIKPGLVADQGAVLLKSSITHSLMMSLLAYGAALLALRERGRRRWALAAVAALAALDVLAAVTGRTGYFVLAILALWLGASRWSARGALAALAAAALALAAAYQWSPTFGKRVDETVAEARSAGGGSPEANSIGQRLHYWKRSAQWIAAHPLLGAGTGGWREAFHASTAGDHPYFRDRSHRHPHHEYLNIGVQLGVGGLALLVALFAAAFVRAGALPEPEAALARGFVLAFAAGCFFNDFLLDATEGHLWAVLGGALFGAGVSRASPAPARAPAPAPRESPPA